MVNIASRHRSPFARVGDEFQRNWLEANCNDDDLKLMKTMSAYLWGPGTVLYAADYLEAELDRAPTTKEVEALLERGQRVMEPCFEAWHGSDEYRALQWEIHGRRL